MKKENITQLLLLVIFLAFSFIYYKLPVVLPQIDKVYITITTFFFSIFTGFFVSQQMSRYTKIREIISNFDGKMSSTYRTAGNVSTVVQKEIGEIIKTHYKALIKTKEWDYHFTHKSNTISAIHAVLENHVASAHVEVLRANAVARIINNLSDCEVARKNMIMLYQERIPRFQWFIIIFFIFVLITTVSAIPSSGLILESVLKSAFCVSLLSIAGILHRLDNVHLFEEFIGENSAKDVIGIIGGKK